MKYVSLEDIKNAQLAQISDNATEYDKGRITGWNECIDALKKLAKEINPDGNDGFLYALAGLSMHYDDELYADGIGQTFSPDVDNEEYPDCEECSFSGLLTND